MKNVIRKSDNFAEHAGVLLNSVIHTVSVPYCLRYGDSVDNTVEENSSV